MNRTIAALVVLALCSTACASRVAHDEHVAMATGGRSSQVATSSSADSGDVLAAESTGGDGAAATNEGNVVTGASGQGGTAPAAGGARSTTRRAATGGSGAPLRIGMIGNFSGVAGASFATARDALKAWVGMTNEKGGINGHPVELYISDDGNEGARDLAIAKDFVENRKVVAIINYFGAAGGPEAVAKYAKEKGVPVIGGAAFDATFFRSPYMFPQITGHENYYFSNAKAMVDRGMKKVAIIYCTEGAVCKENADVFRKYAERVGMEVVYEARVSLAQPDFTAECVNARAAGADSWYPQVDGSSVNRLARSCSRQGYTARYFITAPGEAVDPVIEGAVSTARSFPWFIESGSAALEEYGQAMRKFGGSAPRNFTTTFGWMSAKVFELAAAKVSAQPTAQEILNGLWAMKNETFGGLAPAITFTKGQPAPGANCAFYLEVKGGKWVAPRGMELMGCR